MRIAVLALLIAATVAATLRSGRQEVSLKSLTQLWSDALRDADQPGMRLTRLSAREEMRVGAEQFSAMHVAEDPAATVHLEQVARPMLAYVHRRDIEYRFHVVDEPFVNAFALPGGQILVTTAMMRFVGSDSELAEVVGHEIAHVDLRHAVERHQYEERLGGMVEFAHRLATLPFSSDQELDADAEGLRLVSSAGYDTQDAAAFFNRMEKERQGAVSTPAGEVAQSVGGLFESYFRTHPPSEERARRLRGMAERVRRQRNLPPPPGVK